MFSTSWDVTKVENVMKNPRKERDEKERYGVQRRAESEVLWYITFVI